MCDHWWKERNRTGVIDEKDENLKIIILNLAYFNENEYIRGYWVLISRKWLKLELIVGFVN